MRILLAPIPDCTGQTARGKPRINCWNTRRSHQWTVSLSQREMSAKQTEGFRRIFSIAIHPLPFSLPQFLPRWEAFRPTINEYRHFERWQGNWIRREPKATENPVTRFPSGGIMPREAIAKNHYSFEEPRNLSCGRECRACYSLRCFAAPASKRRIHPPAFGLPPFGLKGRRFDGQAKRLLYSGQTWKSYVGILQRMPKPGSFASIACTLSEHLRARPKHLHL